MNINSSILEYSDEQIMQIARELRVAYELKRTLRYRTQRDFTVHSESVAEHVFALFFLAQYFLPLEDKGRALDAAKLYPILLFHDFGEITHGDIPYHLKTEADSKREQQDAKEVFASLPRTLRDKAEESWFDYEQQKSPESKFAYALDKIEPLFELLDPINERSMKRLKFPYNIHIERKLRATKDFPVMRKFLEVISTDMLKRGVFWEK